MGLRIDNINDISNADIKAQIEKKLKANKKALKTVLPKKTNTSSKKKKKEFKMPNKGITIEYFDDYIKITAGIIKVSTNEYYEGMDWKIRKKIKDLYTKYCQEFKNIKRPIGVVDVIFKYHYKTRILDSDNNTVMSKMFVDCLTTYKTVKDDTPTYISWVANKSIKSPLNHDYVEIYIRNTIDIV